VIARMEFRVSIVLAVTFFALALSARGLGVLRNNLLLAWTSERDGNREIYLWDDGSRQVANLSRHSAWGGAG
jgi:hypothetical protein